MTLDESARRLGRLAWGEQRLFEILGAWVRRAPDDGLAVALATEALHHGAHALELVALLPETRDHDPAELVSAPPEHETAWSELAGVEEPGTGLADLAPLLSEHLAAMAAWLEDASPVRDGPGIRVLTPILARARADRDRTLARTGGARSPA